MKEELSYEYVGLTWHFRTVFIVVPVLIARLRRVSRQRIELRAVSVQTNMKFILLLVAVRQ
jgi:hypothetical protein